MYRFALSLTRDMSVEDLRIGVLNFLCAKQKGEMCVLRFNDTDKKRNIEGKNEEIVTLLGLFELEFQGPFYQSQNLKFYRQFASKLLEEKRAFCCFCSSETIDKKRQNAKENEKPYRYDGSCKNLKDEEVIGNENPFTIRIKGKSNKIDDFVILKEDKYPTCNFANGIDDMLQNVTHVITSENESNTVQQIHVREVLGYHEEIKYTQLSPIANAKSVLLLLEEGYLPEGILNYLILLGNECEEDIFTLKSAEKWFRVENMSNNPIRFDMNELKLINKEHIKLLDDKKLSAMIGYSSQYVGKIAKIYTKEVSTLNEIKSKIDAMFDKRVFEDELKSEHEVLANALINAPVFDTFDEFKEYLINKTKLSEKLVLKILRTLLTNTQDNIGFKNLYPIIKNHLKEIVKW